MHRVDEGADTGEILAQEAFPLSRGFPVTQLRRLSAERGSALLVWTLDAIEGGRVTGRRQDESLATLAPRVRPGTPMIDHQGWDVERVWHFLAGLSAYWHEPLRDERGGVVRYRTVLGYQERVHDVSLGLVRAAGRERILYSRGGIVRLA